MSKYRSIKDEGRRTISNPTVGVSFTCHSGLVTQPRTRKTNNYEQYYSIHRIIALLSTPPTNSSKVGSRPEINSVFDIKQARSIYKYLQLRLSSEAQVQRHRPAMVESSILLLPIILHNTRSKSMHAPESEL